MIQHCRIVFPNTYTTIPSEWSIGRRAHLFSKRHPELGMRGGGGNEGSPYNQSAQRFEARAASIVGDPSLARPIAQSTAQDDGLKKE